MSRTKKKLAKHGYLLAIYMMNKNHHKKTKCRTLLLFYFWIKGLGHYVDRESRQIIHHKKKKKTEVKH